MGKGTKRIICTDTQIVYKSLKDASLNTNISQSSISNCCHGKIKTAGGYR